MSGTDGAVANVGPDNLGIGMVGNDISGITTCLRARATESSRDTLLLRWVERIEPEHASVVLYEGKGKKEKQGLVANILLMDRIAGTENVVLKNLHRPRWRGQEPWASEEPR